MTERRQIIAAVCMLRGPLVHRFGPFEFDPHSRGLLRARKRLRLSPPQAAILEYFLAHPGVVVSKAELMNIGWPGQKVNPNSVDKAVSELRKALGGKGIAFIETVPNQGYRFTVTGHRAEQAIDTRPIELELAPWIDFVQGRTELDTLDRDHIQRARAAFERVLREAPNYGPAHVGLAMACALAYEASAPDERRDTAALAAALEHAVIGCTLERRSGEAWSTLALVRFLNGETQLAVAAAEFAMELERDEWRHALRAGYVSWGDARLRAARKVLERYPELALAYWQRGTVFIARGALDLAIEELRLGCAAQERQTLSQPLPAVGLLLQYGLVCAAQGRPHDAEAAYRRELACTANSKQVYARECAANTWYALGALYLQQRRWADAEAAFVQALNIWPRHVSATAALRCEVPSGLPPFDAAAGQALVFARQNRHADAARVYRDGVAAAAPGCTGWILPVEPILNPLAQPAIWSETLALVRARAT